MKDELPVIIIGSGLAGYNLAKEFRKLDASTPLIIVTQHAGRFYSKPQLSAALTNKKDIAALTMASVEKMAENLSASILSFKTVSDIDAKEKTITCDDKTIAYRQLVLAQGASPIKLALKGEAAEKVISINDLMGYEKFHAMLPKVKRVVILGTGLVGCEFANDLTRHGLAVDIVSPDDYPLQQMVPKAVGELLQATLVEHGVNWHLQQFAESVERTSSGGLCVKTSEKKSLEGDCVISAVGLQPNIALAKQADLNVNRGVCVDEFLQSSDQDIYALGDCAELNGQVKLYVAPLLQCAKALAKTLAGEKTAVNYPLMPVGIKTSLCPLVVLMPEQAEKGQWRIDGDKPNLRALFYNDSEEAKGFVLTGNRIRERMGLLKEIS